jgi:hypothetical protein
MLPRSSARVSRCGIYDSFVLYNQVRFAFGYRERLDPVRLQRSLGRVLAEFGAFAGRLRRRAKSYEIELGVGVDFEVRESADSCLALCAAAATHVGAAKVCPRLPMMKAVLGAAPLLSVRLTNTPDGCVLAFSWHHAVGDFQSAHSMLQAWTKAYRDEPFEGALDVADRDAYLTEKVPDSPGTDTALRVVPWSEIAQVIWMIKRSRRLDLEYSWEELDALQRAAGGGGIRRNDALYAHLFQRCHFLNEMKLRSKLALVINTRKRYRLPANLIGNILDTSTTSVEPGADLATIAHGLRAELKDFGRNPNHHAFMRFKSSKQRLSIRARTGPGHFDPLRGNLIVSSIAGFGAYNLVFESQRPAHVEYGGWENNVWFASILESPGDRGLRVQLALPIGLAQHVAADHARSFARPPAIYS